MSSDGWNGVLPQEFSNFQNAGRNVYKEVAIMWKNKESYVDYGGVFGLSIIKHVTLQKIVAHDFWYDPHNLVKTFLYFPKARGSHNIATRQLSEPAETVPTDSYLN